MRITYIAVVLLPWTKHRVVVTGVDVTVSQKKSFPPLEEREVEDLGIDIVVLLRTATEEPLRVVSFIFLVTIKTSMTQTITKTHLYNFDPLKPHFYIVKLGFAGVQVIFLISAQNIDCGYSLEPPRRGGSNEYQQSMFWAEIWKISQFFYLKILNFWRKNFLYIWIGVFS